MILAVASGKGGTGKTTVAIGLARAAAAEGRTVLFLDCDVEAPNAALFLHPEWEEERRVGVLLPEVDPEKCTGCGRCAEVCAYSALAVVNGKVLLFDDLCHGCGSCMRQCPEKAITERLHTTGSLHAGRAGAILFARGVLDVGRAMAPPVIRELKRWKLGGAGGPGRLAVLDAPPGASCPVVETLRGADRVLLVTEPTPFGLHDLEQAIGLARDALGLPVDVVLNRADEGDDAVERFCEKEGIPVVLRIPFDRKIAEAYSEGIAPDHAVPEVGRAFRDLLLVLAGREGG
ncbi:MAG: ATP-binding protein [Candidatus Eisenbacteria bacterium]|nr:ATP-binding protein [Candidatus Eisenbacteria bacterium]